MNFRGGTENLFNFGFGHAFYSFYTLKKKVELGDVDLLLKGTIRCLLSLCS